VGWNQKLVLVEKKRGKKKLKKASGGVLNGGEREYLKRRRNLQTRQIAQLGARKAF